MYFSYAWNMQEYGTYASTRSWPPMRRPASVQADKLRPPGYLTLETVGLLELSLARGKEQFMALEEAGRLDEIHAYLFIQAAPLALVSRSVRAFRHALKTQSRSEAFEDFVCTAVEPFLATLTPDIQGELAEQLGQLDEIEAARVDASPPPGGKRERPDPNS